MYLLPPSCARSRTLLASQVTSSCPVSQASAVRLAQGRGAPDFRDGGTEAKFSTRDSARLLYQDALRVAVALSPHSESSTRDALTTHDLVLSALRYIFGSTHSIASSSSTLHSPPTPPPSAFDVSCIKITVHPFRRLRLPSTSLSTYTSFPIAGDDIISHSPSSPSSLTPSPPAPPTHRERRRAREYKRGDLVQTFLRIRVSPRWIGTSAAHGLVSTSSTPPPLPTLGSGTHILLRSDFVRARYGQEDEDEVHRADPPRRTRRDGHYRKDLRPPPFWARSSPGTRPRRRRGVGGDLCRANPLPLAVHPRLLSPRGPGAEIATSEKSRRHLPSSRLSSPLASAADTSASLVTLPPRRWIAGAGGMREVASRVVLAI
ncbi:hypothetical protein B0H11DRAFT_2228438 [Mycena galericulata]|nr:hypothetical protein B0H11DRAFT_2228438 [Mycena galericulata]